MMYALGGGAIPGLTQLQDSDDPVVKAILAVGLVICVVIFLIGAAKR